MRLWPRQPTVIVTVCSVIAACEPQPRDGVPIEPRPAPTSEDAIHAGPLAGKIDGQSFAVRTARYFIDTRPGYEKIDVKLYGVASKTPCGEFDSPNPPSVWLRRMGPDKIGPETSVTTVKDGGVWAVHYQIHDKGFWIGNGDANALVVIEDVEPDMRLRGLLSACFRDEAGSCVVGEFSASLCHLGIDEPVRGTGAMERPPRRAVALPAPLPVGSGEPAGDTAEREPKP